MPVVHFEYTNNLSLNCDLKEFVAAVHDTLVDLIKTDLYTCRSTIDCHDNFLIGDGSSENAFISLSVRMLPGRDKATKDRLGNKLLEMINAQFSEEIKRLNTQVRVYLTEVDKAYYYGL